MLIFAVQGCAKYQAVWYVGQYSQYHTARRKSYFRLVCAMEKEICKRIRTGFALLWQFSACGWTSSSYSFSLYPATHDPSLPPMCVLGNNIIKYAIISPSPFLATSPLPSFLPCTLSSLPSFLLLFPPLFPPFLLFFATFSYFSLTFTISKHTSFSCFVSSFITRVSAAAYTPGTKRSF
jgi:hypothetical protein